MPECVPGSWFNGKADRLSGLQLRSSQSTWASIVNNIPHTALTLEIFELRRGGGTVVHPALLEVKQISASITSAGLNLPQQGQTNSISLSQ
jgi:hypothetical protein